MSICIVGSIQTRSWTDQHGQKRYATEVVADEALFVDSKEDKGGGAYMPEAHKGQFEEIKSDDDLPF